ncbi:hypothetical protein KR084_006440 [Drosophila pseudotakahashii]|nr:hypothetical protein KR084_006440 [Drosophila pseudotakahashii]
MRFLTIVAILCSLAACVLSQDETTTPATQYSWDPSSSSWAATDETTTSYPYWADTTTTAPTAVSPPCDEGFPGPCGKWFKGAQKIYVFN